MKKHSKILWGALGFVVVLSLFLYGPSAYYVVFKNGKKTGTCFYPDSNTQFFTLKYPYTDGTNYQSQKNPVCSSLAIGGYDGFMSMKNLLEISYITPSVFPDEYERLETLLKKGDYFSKDFGAYTYVSFDSKQTADMYGYNAGTYYLFLNKGILEITSSDRGNPQFIESLSSLKLGSAYSPLLK